MRICVCLLILCFAQLLAAQSTVKLPISFIPIFQEAELVLDENDEKLSIETLKFYISNVELYKGKKRGYKVPESYYLIDASNANSMTIKLDIPAKQKLTHLKFNLGVDSLTNVSGAFGGDLDPTNGMYWTWQSGYINFKLEGVAAACPARHNRFQYHIGGYQYPHNTLKEVKMKIVDREEIRIELNLDEVFNTVNVAEHYEIMNPNEKAVEFAQLLPSLFSIVTE